MHRFLLSLGLIVFLTGCGTLQRGMTPSAGHLQLQVSPGVVLNTVDLQYGLTDQWALGLGAQTAALFPAVTDAYTLYRFSLGDLQVVPGLGVRAHWFYRQWMPLGMLSVSQKWDIWRPYLALSGDLRLAQATAGLEATSGQLSLFVEAQASYQYQNLGHRDPDDVHGIQFSDRRGLQGVRPVAGLGWRF